MNYLDSVLEYLIGQIISSWTIQTVYKSIWLDHLIMNYSDSIIEYLIGPIISSWTIQTVW